MSKEHLHARVSFKHLHAENFFLLNHQGQEKKKKVPAFVCLQTVLPNGIANELKTRDRHWAGGQEPPRAGDRVSPPPHQHRLLTVL